MASKKDTRGDKIQQLRRGVPGKVVQTYDAASASDLHQFICCAVRFGALVSFSRTQDGGAVVLTILDDELPDGKFKDYFSTDEEIHGIIQQFAGIYGDG